jgi:amino acid transporter
MNAPTVQHSLKPDSIGFLDSLAIGLNATSPAYSLAAVLAPIAVIVGVHAPGILLASFVPMLLIASAFHYLNRVDPDCGTTFSWVTRAMGPWAGWLGGWAITMTGVLVVGSLAQVGVRFLLLMLGLDEAAANEPLITVLSVALILLMTWICVIGTELSARLQNLLVLTQVVGLAVFVGVALWRVYSGDATEGATVPSPAWLNPVSNGLEGLSAGLLLGVFAFWGWESSLNLTEETSDTTETPGRAGLWSTVILVATYVGTAMAVIAFVGIPWLSERAADEEIVFAEIADLVLGPWAWLVLLAVATSAIASTQTTIIPASRTMLSMARRGGGLPPVFGRISARYRTPTVSTWCVAAIGIVWYVLLRAISDNALFDSLTALSLLIAFYYALTGIACAVYYRRRLLDDLRTFFLVGVGPATGAGMLLWLLGLSVLDMSDPENSYSGEAWFGLGPPLVIGIGIFLAGVLIMLAQRLGGGPFWSERPQVVPPATATGGH